MKNGRPAATEAALVADLLERVTSGDAWHGDNVEQLLDGLSAADAARHPVAGAHSIWELVLHMTGWAEEVRARLLGAEAGEPTAGDWPEPPGVRDSRNRAAGTGLSRYLTVHGLVHHTVYHAGQIALLRRALEE